MRRPRRKLEVNTFPFLAVLLCAMGAFILLLMVIDRRAKIVSQNKARDAYLARRLQIESEREAAAIERDARARKAKAEWQARNDEIRAELQAEENALARQIEEVVAALAKSDAALTQRSSASVELARKAAVEDAALKTLQKELLSRQDRLEEARQASQGHRKLREQLTRELAVLEAALRNVRERQSRERPVYSLVPYKGKHGSDARPIYVEVAGDSLAVHPGPTVLEATRSSLDDFRSAIERRSGPLVTETIRPGEPPRDEPGRPYVLFLVRPSGIERYYQALQALRGYRVDFGYELVEPDWVFDFSNDGIDSQPWRTAAKLDVEPANVTRPAPKGIGPRATTGGPPDLPPSGLPSVGLPSVPQTPGGNSPRGLVAGTPTSLPPGSRFGGLGTGGFPPGSGPTAPGGSDGQFAGIPRGGSGPVGANPALPSGGSPGLPGTISPGAPPGSGAVGSASPSRIGPPTLEPFNVPSTGGVSAGPPPNRGVPTGSSASAPQHGRGSASPSLGGPGGVPPFAPPNFGGAAPVGGSPPEGFAAPNRLPGNAAAQGSGSSDRGSSQPDAGRSPQEPGAIADASTPDRPLKFRNVNGPDSTGNPRSPGAADPGGPRGPASTDAASPSPVESTDAGPRYGSSPFVHSPADKAGPRLPALGRIIGNRDFLMTVECFANSATLTPPGKTFDLSDPEAVEKLAAQIRSLVAGRQRTVRPGEPPYRPLLQFRVQPDGRRTYYAVYPRLAEFGFPMSRESAD